MDLQATAHFTLSDTCTYHRNNYAQEKITMHRKVDLSRNVRRCPAPRCSSVSVEEIHYAWARALSQRQPPNHQALRLRQHIEIATSPRDEGPLFCQQSKGPATLEPFCNRAIKSNRELEWRERKT
jgi:hypothetical protein